MTPSKGRRLRFRQHLIIRDLERGQRKGAQCLEVPVGGHPIAISDSEAEAHLGRKDAGSRVTCAHRPARRTSRRADEARGRGGAGIPLGCRIWDGSKRVTREATSFRTELTLATPAHDGRTDPLGNFAVGSASSFCPFPASVRRQPGEPPEPSDSDGPEGEEDVGERSERASDELDLPVVDRVVDVALSRATPGHVNVPEASGDTASSPSANAWAASLRMLVRTSTAVSRKMAALHQEARGAGPYWAVRYSSASCWSSRGWRTLVGCRRSVRPRRDCCAPPAASRCAAGGAGRRAAGRAPRRGPRCGAGRQG